MIEYFVIASTNGKNYNKIILIVFKLSNLCVLVLMNRKHSISLITHEIESLIKRFNMLNKLIIGPRKK